MSFISSFLFFFLKEALPIIIYTGHVKYQILRPIFSFVWKICLLWDAIERKKFMYKAQRTNLKTDYNTRGSPWAFGSGELRGIQNNAVCLELTLKAPIMTAADDNC